MVDLKYLSMPRKAVRLLGKGLLPMDVQASRRAS